MAFADAWAGSAKHQDFSAANSGRDRNAPESLFSFVQRLWHRDSLAQGSGLEKEFFGSGTNGDAKKSAKGTYAQTRRRRNFARAWLSGTVSRTPPETLSVWKFR